MTKRQLAIVDLDVLDSHIVEWCKRHCPYPNALADCCLECEIGHLAHRPGVFIGQIIMEQEITWVGRDMSADCDGEENPDGHGNAMAAFFADWPGDEECDEDDG